MSEIVGDFALSVCTGKIIEIRDVWSSNLDHEMAYIREIVRDYPYVAMVR